MVEIIQEFIPRSKRNRPGFSMQPRYITTHDTGNTHAMADAERHAAYLTTKTAEDIPISWHFTVDDTVIYQHLPLDESGYHAGDGSGQGNRSSIGIEICMNKGANRSKAELNAAWLHANLIKDFNLSLKDVRQHWHWSGKNCPQVIRGRVNGWEGFKDQIEWFLLHSAPTWKQGGLLWLKEQGLVTAEYWTAESPVDMGTLGVILKRMEERRAKLWNF